MNKENVEITEKLETVLRNIWLQTDLINYIPSVEKIDSKEALYHYEVLDKTLGNIFEINKDLIKKLDDVLVYLYDIDEENK